MARVLLLSLPFVGCERPSLGLSLLQAQLRRRSVPCDLRYLTFELADRLGIDTYEWVSNELPYTAFVGDWVFARSLYGPDPRADREYVRQVLVGQWRLDRSEIERIYRVRAACESFLASCLSAPGWASYHLIGFTSTFTQNLASLALARLLKSRFPAVSIVFGGANWDDEMGEALHSVFPFVDFVCRGEAEHSFPELVDAVTGGASAESTGRRLAEIPGLVFRRGGQSVSNSPAPPLRDLDSLPRTDYADYQRDRSASREGEKVAPRWLLETSRGCWWGAKSHCTFCGLNAGTMAFRSKSADRVLAEIRDLADRYEATQIEVVDNILDMRYFKSLLPRLRDEGPEVKLFFEVKANLGFEQVRVLHEAGVHALQPGIESLSDHVLNLMGKGTTALQNIRLLKWCKEFGIRPEWNLLYGFPGETELDYLEMLPLIEAIRFLDAPSGCGPVRLDRFSPYHRDPAAYGMHRVRPSKPYRFLYPTVSEEERMRISYYFDYDRVDGVDPEAYARPVVDAVRRWQADSQPGGLWLRDVEEDVVAIVDQRSGRRRRTLRLEGWRARVYLACDQIHTRSSLGRWTRGEASEEELESFLVLMEKVGLMARCGDRVLGLAVRSPCRRRAVKVPPPCPVEPRIPAVASGSAS